MSKIETRRSPIVLASRIESLMLRYDFDKALFPVAKRLGWSGTKPTDKEKGRLELVRHILRTECQFGPKELNLVLQKINTPLALKVLNCLDIDVPDVKPVIYEMPEDQKINDELIKERSSLAPEPIISPYAKLKEPEMERYVQNVLFPELEFVGPHPKVFKDHDKLEEISDLLIEEFQTVIDGDVPDNWACDFNECILVIEAIKKWDEKTIKDTIANHVFNNGLEVDDLFHYVSGKFHRLNFTPTKPEPIAPKKVIPMPQPQMKKPWRLDVKPEAIYTVYNDGKNHTFKWNERLSVFSKLNPKKWINVSGGDIQGFGNKFPIIFDQGITNYGWSNNTFFDNGGYSPFFPLPEGEDDSVQVIHLKKYLGYDEEGDVVKNYISFKTKDGQHDEAAYAARVKHLMDMIDRSYFATVSGDRLKLWMSNKPREWMSHMKDSGIDIQIKPKTMKRVEAVTGPYLLTATKKINKIRFAVITSSKDMDAVYDGGSIYIRKSLYLNLIEQFKIDPLNKKRGERHLSRLESAWIVSFRALIPVGTNYYEKGAMIKGHAHIVPDEIFDELHGKDLDLVTHTSNVKSEIQGSKDWMFGINPHFGKEKSRTNAAYCLYKNIRREVPSIITNEVNRIKHDMFYGKPLETLQDMIDLEDTREVDSTGDVQEHYRWAAHVFAEHGLKMNNSMTVRNQIWKALTIPFNQMEWNDQNKIWEFTDKINVPIPCSRYVQIFSETVALLAGVTFRDLKSDQIAISHRGFAVVTDSTWLDMIPNHGGCDQDDYFTLIYRVDVTDGKQKVLILRSPNDYGEYTLLTPYREDDCPRTKFFTPDENDIPQMEYQTWPEADLSVLPKRLSTTNPQYADLGDPTPDKEGAVYDRDYVKSKFLQSIGGGNAGLGYNVNFLLTYILNRNVKKPLSLEKMIDTATQERNAKATIMIESWCNEALGWVHSKGFEIDSVMAHYRFKREEFPTHKGWIQYLCEFIQKTIGEGKKWIEAKIPFEMADVWKVTTFTDGKPLSLGGNDKSIMDKCLEDYKQMVFDDMWTKDPEAIKKMVWSAVQSCYLKDLAYLYFYRKLMSLKTKKGQPWSDNIFVSGEMWKMYESILIIHKLGAWPLNYKN